MSAMFDNFKPLDFFRENYQPDEKNQQETNISPLEDYQKDAIKFIMDNFGKGINSLCALDVGMGKTRVACEILCQVIDNKREKKDRGYALVCCPKNGLIETIWVETLHTLKLKTMLLSGKDLKIIKMTRKKVLTIPPYMVCLITYHNLIKNIDYLINTPPSMIIFDEYHTVTNNIGKNIRNTGTQ